MLTRNCAVVQKDNLFTSLPLGNTAGTEIRTRLRLRSTCRGGNNRLDVDKILSYDRGSDLGVPMLGVFLPSPLSCSHQLRFSGSFRNMQILSFDNHFKGEFNRALQICLRCADHANGEEEEEVGGRQYKRGLAPYTFVAWEHMQDSILNLPVHKMDFYVAG